ncbi:MAG: hypothetical protein DBY37_05045 [Desulfovibrionaceae bacterium]|nr:MAG: hypothetical protein DBY37_05045 [Desulfovibrionaceae bacterium]
MVPPMSCFALLPGTMEGECREEDAVAWRALAGRPAEFGNSFHEDFTSSWFPSFYCPVEQKKEDGRKK